MRQGKIDHSAISHVDEGRGIRARPRTTRSVTELTLVLFLAIIAGASASEAADTIAFSDAAALRAIPCCHGPAAPLSFANFYREKGMTFTANVDPPDPALEVQRICSHYHLNFLDPNATFAFVGGVLTAGRCTVPLTSDGLCPSSRDFVPFSPIEAQPRSLSPHDGGNVIQLTYDPNNDGILDRFNLVSIVVSGGKLNLGTKSATGRLCVYNDLTAGFEWGLTGECATNLTRATLEIPGTRASCFDPPDGTGFTVDQIAFEPSSSLSTAPIAPRTTSALVAPDTIQTGKAIVLRKLTDLPSGLNPAVHELLSQIAPAVASLRIDSAHVDLRGPGEDGLKVQGRMSLSVESDGIDVLKEDVTVALGEFRATIPAGRFTCDADQTTCRLEGPLGVISGMEIAAAGDEVTFELQVKGLDLSGIDRTDPAPLSLQIGDDFAGTPFRIDRVQTMSGKAHGVGLGSTHAGIAMVGTFQLNQDIKLGAVPAILTLTGLLNDGTADILGLPLTLVGDPRNNGKSAYFRTPAGVIPAVRVSIGARSEGEFTWRIEVSGATYSPSNLCPHPILTTAFVLQDGVNPPVTVATRRPWLCFGGNRYLRTKP